MIGWVFFALIKKKKKLLKIKNSIFHTKYERYGKNVITQNFLLKWVLKFCFEFQKHLKIKNSIFKPKYMRCGINGRMQNYTLKVVRSRKLDLEQKYIILLSRIAILLLKG